MDLPVNVCSFVGGRFPTKIVHAPTLPCRPRGVNTPMSLPPSSYCHIPKPSTYLPASQIGYLAFHSHVLSSFQPLTIHNFKMSTTLASPSKPLAARSPNTSSPTKPPTQEKNEKVAPQSMEYHRQVLQNRLAAENAYVPQPLPASLSSPNPFLPRLPF